jgi:hypothetical protein
MWVLIKGGYEDRNYGLLNKILRSARKSRYVPFGKFATFIMEYHKIETELRS